MNLSIGTKWASKIKSSLLFKTLLHKVYSYCSFNLPTIQLFYSAWEKSLEDIYYYPPHVSVITGNILMKHPKHPFLLFPTALSWLVLYILRYNLYLSKLEWTRLLFKFNYIRGSTKRRKLFSIPVAEYVTFSHQNRTLKTNLLGLISNISKYFLKTGTICLLSYFHIYLPL